MAAGQPIQTDQGRIHCAVHVDRVGVHRQGRPVGRPAQPQLLACAGRGSLQQSRPKRLGVTTKRLQERTCHSNSSSTGPAWDVRPAGRLSCPREGSGVHLRLSVVVWWDEPHLDGGEYSEADRASGGNR